MVLVEVFNYEFNLGLMLYVLDPIECYHVFKNCYAVAFYRVQCTTFPLNYYLRLFVSKITIGTLDACVEQWGCLYGLI